jgi:hypothetical protein
MDYKTYPRDTNRENSIPHTNSYGNKKTTAQCRRFRLWGVSKMPMAALRRYRTTNECALRRVGIHAHGIGANYFHCRGHESSAAPPSLRGAAGLLTSSAPTPDQHSHHPEVHRHRWPAHHAAQTPRPPATPGNHPAPAPARLPAAEDINDSTAPVQPHPSSARAQAESETWQTVHEQCSCVLQRGIAVP